MREWNRKRDSAAPGAAAMVFLAGLALAACSSGPQPIDRVVEGAFTNNSPRLQTDNSPYADYMIDADAGWQVTIDMMSNELDAFLWLLHSNGEILASDDDGGAGLNARIRYTVPERGAYIVRANTYDEDELGAYTLQIQSGPPQ